MKSLKLLTSAFMLSATSLLLANPQGFDLIIGEATLATPNQKTIEVTTGKQSVIQWKSFSIGEHETTRFIMPDKNAAVLNRVMGGKLSQILGTLEANGKVFLINPKGVFVGEKAHVNTSSFIASSFDVLNREFLKGGDIAFKGKEGSVINLGSIVAEDGDVFLIGYQVTNAGSIEAPLGNAGLAAGRDILLQSTGHEKILIRAALSDTIADTGILNSGRLKAVQAEVKADGNLYSYAIKESGKVEALRIAEGEGNKIYLVAHNGTVETSGELTAFGGEIQVLGDQIALLSGSRINVSHETGGGVALIGGDFKGSNPDIPNATYVRIEENALIQADALVAGDGGRVVVWGNQLSSFFGEISAQGGSESGHGGFVEVSSKGLIVPSGNISTLAAHGKTGTLLLDPCAVTIAGDPVVESGFAPVPSCPTMTNPVGFNFAGNPTSVIHASRISSLLNCTNVEINASASGTAPSGSISAESPITWNSTNSLTLTANDTPTSFVRFLSTIKGSNGALIVNASLSQVGDISGMITTPVSVNVGTVTVNGVDLTVQGSPFTGASSQLLGKTVTANLSGDLTIQGANALGAFGAISASGTPLSQGSITGNILGEVTLTAGNGVSSSAAITGTNSTIAIGSMMTPVIQVTLTASDLSSYANAYISTYTSGGIDIHSTGDVILDAGLQAGCNADIFTVGADNYDSHINVVTISGDIVLKGGGA